MGKSHYLKLITEHFPELAESTRSAANTVRLIRHGWDNDVLILDNRLIFRFPKDANASARFKTEIKFLQLLRGTVSLLVPDYAYLPEDLSFGGYPIIPGVAARRTLLRNLGRARRDRIARDLGQFLSSLHGVALSDARRCGITEDFCRVLGKRPADERKI